MNLKSKIFRIAIAANEREGQSSQQNDLTQLKSLHKSIKQNYAAFAKGLATVYEFQSKLADPLKLSDLDKNVDLMRIGVMMSLMFGARSFSRGPDRFEGFASRVLVAFGELEARS
jgi:hypothetical protein